MFLEFNRTVERNRLQVAVRTAATRTVNREHFEFPDRPTANWNDATAMRHGRALSALDLQLTSHAFLTQEQRIMNDACRLQPTPTKAECETGLIVLRGTVAA